MSLKQCEQGHLYDPRHHHKCPYCGVDIPDFQPTQRIDPPPHLGQQDGSPTQKMARPDSGQAAGNASDTSPKTVFVWDGGSKGASAEAGETTVTEPQRDFDPVVGWLVGIEGRARGRDFRLKAGRNGIGRSASAEVHLDDESISRGDRAAIITYDPRANAFQILPGDGRVIAYCNGEAVHVPQKLNSFDVVELGQSKLRFVALCGESFQW